MVVWDEGKGSWSLGMRVEEAGCWVRGWRKLIVGYEGTGSWLQVMKLVEAGCGNCLRRRLVRAVAAGSGSRG